MWCTRMCWARKARPKLDSCPRHRVSIYCLGWDPVNAWWGHIGGTSNAYQERWLWFKFQQVLTTHVSSLPILKLAAIPTSCDREWYNKDLHSSATAHFGCTHPALAWAKWSPFSPHNYSVLHNPDYVMQGHFTRSCLGKWNFLGDVHRFPLSILLWYNLSPLPSCQLSCSRSPSFLLYIFEVPLLFVSITICSVAFAMEAHWISTPWGIPSQSTDSHRVLFLATSPQFSWGGRSVRCSCGSFRMKNSSSSESRSRKGNTSTLGMCNFYRRSSKDTPFLCVHGFTQLLIKAVLKNILFLEHTAFTGYHKKQIWRNIFPQAHVHMNQRPRENC